MCCTVSKRNVWELTIPDTKVAGIQVGNPLLIVGVEMRQYPHKQKATVIRAGKAQTTVAQAQASRRQEPSSGHSTPRTRAAFFALLGALPPGTPTAYHLHAPSGANGIIP